ncbi:hypothetical protein GM418_18400 [Maribellus comscasis]|uniref:Uncharacterized protein n=1 Tax=Maribellus comscasis TaxID=2681766 RepID=A0A6I6JW83_9BACT|nr:hypothetical protein [Maribellus comscasis]QGY45569.1 hypothetical protein GM418_18400 [Maribellus comscasis]
MAKRISIIIINLGIVVWGIIGFNHLNYWERSARIFQVNSEQNFRRGFDRGRPGFEDRSSWDRSTLTERPDLLNLSDSIAQQSADVVQRNRESIRERNSEDRSYGRRGFHSRQKIQLRNVVWFLAVFCLFTVGTIYTDKTIRAFRKKEK